MEWGEYMEIVSIPDMLYNPSDRIPPYLIAKGNVAEPSGDDGTIGSLRAQQFVLKNEKHSPTDKHDRQYRHQLI